MTVSDRVSPRGRSEPARPPSKSATVTNSVDYYCNKIRSSQLDNCYCRSTIWYCSLWR